MEGGPGEGEGGGGEGEGGGGEGGSVGIINKSGHSNINLQFISANFLSTTFNAGGGGGGCGNGNYKSC